MKRRGFLLSLLALPALPVAARAVPSKMQKVTRIQTLVEAAETPTIYIGDPVIKTSTYTGYSRWYRDPQA